MDLEILNASVDLLAVLISGVLSMFLGAIYYNTNSMGKHWMKMVGIKAEDVKSSTAMRSFGIAFITLMVSFVFIGILFDYIVALNDYTELVSGVLAGLIAWVFASMTYLMNTMYAMRSIKLWVLDMAYVLGCFMIAGTVFTLI